VWEPSLLGGRPLAIDSFAHCEIPKRGVATVGQMGKRGQPNNDGGIELVDERGPIDLHIHA
jgi:hypothetical protein